MNATEKRMEAVRLMKSRTRKNTYTNGGDRKYFFGKPDNVPGNTTQKGWSDCSSAVRKAIQAAAEFVQPTGAHDAYNLGDRVTFSGRVYESIINGNFWSPDVYPDGWTEIV